MTDGPAPTALDAWADELARMAISLAVAFTRGATMWCVAPTMTPHARHLAVEFVHPVIVGKRALPAVAITGSHAVAELRAVTRAADVIAGIGLRDDAVLRDVERRSHAWGTTFVRIAGDASSDRDLVVSYHVLWELTHVCLEHPGLLAGEPSPGCDEHHCVTCADDGMMAEVVALPSGTDAVVRTPHGHESIDVSIAGPVVLGSLVLVHAGTAIACIDEQ
jgi:hypothetical protein